MSLNPYRERLKDYPGRILRFDEFDHDVSRVQTIIADNQARGRRVFCEIGSGSGAHLIGRGHAVSQAVFFGIELRFKRAVRTFEKAEPLKIENIYVLRVHAARLGEIFPAQSLDGVYVLFPDPWEKRSQQKHRLVQNTFLDVIAQRVKVGGFLLFKSDHEDYFRHVENMVSQHRNWQIDKMTPSAQDPALGLAIRSEFEQLFVNQGLPIYQLVARRSLDP